MSKKLLCLLILMACCGVKAQAPSWQWASDAGSSNEEMVNEVAHDASSGNVYAAGGFKGNLSAKYGSSFSAPYGNEDGLLVQYNASGAVNWAIKIGGTGEDEVTGVAVDPSGNIYVSGFFNGTADFDPSSSTFSLVSAGKKDGFLAKYASSGSFLWALKFGGAEDETSGKMAADANGIYITGSYESLPATFYSYSSATTKTATGSGDKVNMFGAKYTNSGVAQWVIAGWSDKDDAGYSVVADANYVYYIGKYEDAIVFNNASGAASATLQTEQNSKPQAFIIAASQAGAISWCTNITTSSGGRKVEPCDIAQDNSNLYVTGYSDGDIDFRYPSPALTQNNTSNNDLFLAKLSKTGNFTWRVAVTGSGSGNQFGRCVDVDYNGNIILTGQFTSVLNYGSAGGPTLTASGQDVFVTAYSAAGAFLWSTHAGGSGNEIMNGLSTDNAGGIYVGGSHSGATAFGSYTLGTGGNIDIFVAKIGCPTLSNNTIAGSQTICAGTPAGTLTGSVPGGATNYKWQMSTDSISWVNAAGTLTNQNYVPSTLTVTTYFRRNVYASGSCSDVVSSSQMVVIKVDQQPNANAGSSQSLCAASGTLAATNPSVGTGSWSLLSGSGTITSINNPSSQVTSLGTGTNTFIWTVSNGSCPSATSAVTITRDQAPSSNAGTNQTVCAASATLSATNPSVGTGTWSLLSGSGTITSTSNASSQVTSLGTGTNTFIWTVSNGSCPSATSAVSIVKDQAPTSNAGTDQTVCASSVTLAAISPTTGTGTWSLLSGSGTITSASNPSSQVTSLGTGTNTFIWTVTNGSCPSASSAVSIVRDQTPTSNAGSNQTVCAASATLAATNPSVGTGSWSLLSGSGTITSASNPSSQVISLGTGTNTFIWTVTNGSCPSATSAVSIVKDQTPTSNAGTNQTVCASSATLAAISPSTGNGTWSLVSGSGTITSISNPSSQVTSLGTGTNTFVWTVSNGSCPSATSAVSIVRDQSPTSNAGTDQTVCATSATLAATNPSVGTGSWSLLSGSGTITSASNPSSQVTSLGTGTNTFIWTVSNGSCPSATSAVSIVKDQAPSSNAGTDQTVCAISATLAAISPSTGTGSWSLLSGSGTIIAASNPSSQVTSLGTGTNTFIWTVTNGSCPSATSAVTIIRDQAPSSNAGTDQTVCTSSASLAAISPSTGTGAWSLLSGSGTITSINNPSSQVTSLGTGTNTFIWTVSNGSCPSATSAVSIIRDQAPTSNAGTDQTVCATSATLAATNPSVGSGTWSLLSGSGTITSASNPSSQVTSLGTGTNTFIWTVTNGSCPSATSAVAIIRDQAPTSNAGTNQTVCAASATLAATNPTIGSGTWSLVSGSGTITAVNNPSSQVTSLGTGTNTFVWTVTNGSCPTATSAVTIVKDQAPTSNAGTNQTMCAASASLAATNPSVGTGNWSLLSGSGTITSINNPSSQVTSLGTGTNTFIWTVTNGSCPSATSAVSIVKDQAPTSNAGTNQTMCAASATLAATNPSVGTGNWSLLSGSGTITAASNPSSQVTSLGTGTNTFVWTVTNGSCPSATSAVTIIRDQAPTSNAGSNQTVCASSASLAAISPSTGTGSWSLLSGSGTITAVNNPSSQITSLGTGTNTFIWTVTNGSCPSSTATVSIIKIQPPTANAGANQTICASSATLSAVNLNGTGSWSVLSGPATIGSGGTPTAIASSLGTGNNQFVWTVTNGACPPAYDTVSVMRDAEPSAAIAGSDLQVCGTTVTLSANTPASGTGQWNLLGGSGAFTDQFSAQTTFSSQAGGRSKAAWVIRNGTCPASADTVEVTFYTLPSSANAGENIITCASQCTLPISQPSSGTGAWLLISGNCSLTPDGSIMQVQLGAPGRNVLKWTVTNGVCPEVSDTLEILRNDGSGSVDAGTDQVVERSSSQLSALLPAAAKGQWTVLQGGASVANASDPNSGISKLSFGNNVFRWTVSTGSACPESSDDIVIYVKPLSIPNAFSPNKDGINDRFVISSLEYFGSARFSVYNRWGVLLYASNDYRNDWEGSSSAGEKLPDDTYYYTLEIPEYKTYSGFITLKQNR